MSEESFTTTRRQRARLDGTSRGIWLAAGVLLGIVLTVLAQMLLAPQPDAVRTASGQQDVAITVDDALLTRLATTGIARANLPFGVTNVQAHALAGDLVAISGDVPALGYFGPRRLAASAQVGASGGHLALHITGASVGGLALPATVTSMLESALNDRLATLTDTFTVLGTHYKVIGAQSAPGALTLMLAAV